MHACMCGLLLVSQLLWFGHAAAAMVMVRQHAARGRLGDALACRLGTACTYQRAITHTHIHVAENRDM